MVELRRLPLVLDAIQRIGVEVAVVLLHHGLSRFLPGLVTLSCRTIEPYEGSGEAFAADCEVVEGTWMILLYVEVVCKRILVPRLANPIRLRIRHALDAATWILYILRGSVVHLRLRLLAIRARLILRLPHIDLLSLILIYLLHPLRLEVVHCLPSMQWLLAALVLLEIVHMCLLLHLLLLVALDDNVWPVPSDQYFGWHS